MHRSLRRTTFWLLVATVFTLPWQGSILLPAIGTAPRLLGLLAGATAAVTLFLHGWHRRILDVHVLAGALAGWAILSLLWTLDAERTRTYVVTFVQLVLLLLLVWEFADIPGDTVRLLRAWVLGCAVGAVGVLLTLGETATDRHSAFGFNENDLGSLLALGVPVAWYLARRAGPGRERWLSAAYLPLGALGALLTGSRGALVVLAVGLAIVPLTVQRRTAAHLLVAIAGLLAAGAVVIAAVPPETEARLFTVADELREGDLSHRLPLWQAAVGSIGTHPVGGIGAGTGDLEIANRTGIPQRAHNTFLSVGMELGVVGLALLLLVIVVTVLRTTSMPRLDRVFARVLIAALLVAMVPLHWELQKAVYALLAIVLCLAAENRPVSPDPSARRSPLVLEGPATTR
ncbi:O-antigen ligase family protein [Egicoccus sp. AB-alg2]|uniref:O-antigen ligase family protein n=1 Tax=Egicoccus sp. AB-alg2 TaxID=3242693 RepID=UPI00359EFF67